MLARRSFIRSLCASGAVFSLDQLLRGTGVPLPVQFVNVAREAGLREKTVFGGEKQNRYLLETTGCGVAFVDYDDDGWLDIFVVNGTRFEPDWPQGQAPDPAGSPDRDRGGPAGIQGDALVGVVRAEGNAARRARPARRSA